MFTENANRIFNRVIEEYHRWDDVDRPVENPYEPGTIDHLLYHKNWIDTVQWHLEDISVIRRSTLWPRWPSNGASTSPIRSVRTWWSTSIRTCSTNTGR